MKNLNKQIKITKITITWALLKGPIGTRAVANPSFAIGAKKTKQLRRCTSPLEGR